jgi:hypothetical protein
MGTCLAELCAVLKRQGFIIPAAGNFVAQHSFVCAGFPIAEGRPDQDDLRQAAEFGRRVAGRIAEGAEDITCVYGLCWPRIHIRSKIRRSGRIIHLGYSG